MNKIGFPISTKKNEKRRAILPIDIMKVDNPNHLYLETGYGDVLGISDEEYSRTGVNIVSKEEVLSCDVICDPKLGDADYLYSFTDSKILFGYMHAVQNIKITNAILETKSTAIAWEDMFEGNKHVFWKNNQLAGSSSILHAFTFFGRMPEECNVALIGKGNAAIGALKILNRLGANVEIFDRKSELRLRNELGNFDVIVNALLWDTSRTDHIIYNKDLKRMKANSFIIDISCDNNGAIESSYPTSITDPTYIYDGILHYAVDHTPSLFYKTATKNFSEEIIKYLDFIITNENLENDCLKDATIIYAGNVLDERINKYQQRTSSTL